MKTSGENASQGEPCLGERGVVGATVVEATVVGAMVVKVVIMCWG